MIADHDGKFLASTKREPGFVSRGFTYWKEEAKIAFKKHQSSDCHKGATEAIVSLPKQVRDVGKLLSEARADADSNLLQLLQLQCVHCPELSVWLSKKTGKYTSHYIQNEMKIMAQQIL